MNLGMLMLNLVAEAVSINIKRQPSKSEVDRFRKVVKLVRSNMTSNEKRKYAEIFYEINNNLDSIDFSKSLVSKLEYQLADLEETIEIWEAIDLIKKRELNLDKVKREHPNY